MKKQGGFTLIELVVVIVILGILAVTAAPRFLNLQNDARKASLQGLKGAIDGAAGIVYGKAAVQGVDTSTIATDVAGIQTIYGYPTATSAGIVTAVKGFSEDWAFNTNSAGLVATFLSSSITSAATATEITNTNCYVTYQQATSTAVGTEAKTSITDSGC